MTCLKPLSLLISACLTVAALNANARTLAEVMQTKTLNVVTTAASPPHGFLDPSTNSLQGIMVDVANAIGKHLGVTVQLTDVPFDGLIPTLTSGRADLMAAPLFITEDRAKVVNFTSPIYGWGEGVVIRSGDTNRYRTLADFKGKKVGTLVDSIQYKMISALPGTDVSTYQDYFSLLADVRVGRIDLGVVDPPSVLYQIKAKSIPGVKLDSGYQAQKKWLVGACTQKSNTALLASVNDVIAKMKQDGELHAILAKWGVADLEIH
ncbi:ABC transporter substrate-binding protein [Paraburkholderia susongensis]|uniref:Amino acid ABC transporter substrate-binding protein, PAAT family n=1 Tax=Paraburkholderia susongensis TaxID=1515439 RepID=A0A1X7M5N1_9BURK|nr:ABC transporter substrate-binding protein [Paraburkholderia susongensis]SMG61027.1 amino acid ABC transporter substrate-binding protein, PAAT family [Paraburkholderia susongensis]